MDRNIDIAITASGLSKKYDVGSYVVEGVDLSIERGEIYGFIGANGAGKSTTIRMILGLVAPTAGTGTILGRPFGSQESMRRVGSIVDSAGFVPGMSGRENARMIGRYLGASNSDVDSALEVAGIADAGRKPYKKYSLGMKQRLALAVALIGDTDVLVLDEPTNGLDPVGIAAFRALIREKAARGVTVFLSSHVLTEVESLCDRVGILHDGRLHAEGAVDEIHATLGVGLRVRIRVSDPVAARELLVQGYPHRDVAIDGSFLVVSIDSEDEAAQINSLLTRGEIVVTALSIEAASLESMFLEIAGGPQ